MHGRPQQAVGPVAQQVADVYEDGRAGVVLCPRGAHGHGRPRPVRQVDFQPGLAAQPEQEGDAAVVRVGARADVLGCVPVLAEGLRRRVVQEAEDVAAWPALAEVAVAEEGWRLDLEADAEEVVYFQGEVVAEFICIGLAVLVLWREV